MSSLYETKTRYERGARMAEARRARRSAACFGRRLTVGPARIEPTAHWRHTASRRQRRAQRRAQPAARGALCRHRPARNLPQPVRWQPLLIEKLSGDAPPPPYYLPNISTIPKLLNNLFSLILHNLIYGVVIIIAPIYVHSSTRR